MFRLTENWVSFVELSSVESCDMIMTLEIIGTPTDRRLQVPTCNAKYRSPLYAGVPYRPVLGVRRKYHDVDVVWCR